MLPSPRSIAAVLLIGAIVLAVPPSAQADFFYQIQDDGVDMTGVLTPAGNAFSNVHTTTNFDITIVSSFTVQASGLTTLDTQIQARMRAGVTGQHQLEMELAFTNYALPVGSPLLVTTSGAANFGDSALGDSATGQAWGNPANTSQFNVGVTAGMQVANSPGGSAFGVVMNPNPAVFSFSRMGNFSLNQDITITLTNDINTTGHAEILTDVTALPAPAGFILAMTGLPVMTIGQWLRRQAKRPKLEHGKKC
jgi:hypothetical protein